MNSARRLVSALLLGLPILAQPQPDPSFPPDPCESLLAGSATQPAWPGIVLEASSGDTLVVMLKDIGTRRVKLAGLRAPKGAEPLATVSRFHLSRIAKGLRVFVILDPPWPVWPEEVTAPVEDFAEAQLAAGLARRVDEELKSLTPYWACRCVQAEQRAKDAKLGLWGSH
jgi:endonuclease YncB( thermonuclease family)